MAIRAGYTVGRSTGEASLQDQLKRYQTKTLTQPLHDDSKLKSRRSLYEQNDKLKLTNPTNETLLIKCTKVVADNFATRPVKEILPPQLMLEITKQLSSKLPPVIGARYIYDESYWKRCSIEKYGWHNCTLSEHGLIWKQLYFEKYIQDRLENFDAQTDSRETLYEEVESFMDYIFTLTFKQLPSHMDIAELCLLLPNLSKIDVMYGVNKLGMNYERMLFGMKISDATALARMFDRADTLTTVILSGNLIDDDLLRMLMTGLIKNNTITSLDLSHNRITNHGARLISKLLGENSVIVALNLADNQIHTEGGRYLARGLRENDSLLQLNLRLNRLTDEGCRLLLEGLQDNVSVTDLNISNNGANSQAAQTLFSIVRDSQHHLRVLDISGNDLDSNQFELFRLSLSANSSLCSLDMRSNPGYNEGSRSVVEIDRIVYNNEIQSKK